MKKIISFLMFFISLNALSQVHEIGSLKAYSETTKISADVCLRLMTQKYGRKLCKVKAFNLEEDFVGIELKKTTSILEMNNCRISIIRKINHIQVGIGEFDENISIAKAKRCLYMAENQGQLNSSLEFNAVKRDR